MKKFFATAAAAAVLSASIYAEPVKAGPICESKVRSELDYGRKAISVAQKLYDQKQWMLLVNTLGQQTMAAEATMMDLVKSKCLIGLEVVNVSASTKKEWNRQLVWGEKFLSKLQQNSELQAFMFTHELFGSF